MYYNPKTQEMLSDQELKNLLNCSFPKDTESVNGWLYIHEARPEPEEGYAPVKDSIQIEDGKAYQTYRMEEVPEAEESASEIFQGIPDRVESLERKFNSLKESIPTAESQQESSEDLSRKVAMLESCIEELAAMMSNLHVYCTNAVEEAKGAK